jgi:NAD(P)H-dependent flavin oxidoreductase YrpB (nitropropane dioxygenase family)
MGKRILKTRVSEMVGAEYPVFCAGMGSFFFNLKAVTGARLAAAVSEAGGLGVIGAGMMSLDELREAIREVRSSTKKPFGVDLLLPASIDRDVPDFSEFSDLSFDHLLGMLPKEQREFVTDLKKELGVKDTSVPLKFDTTTMRPRDAVDICLEEKVPVFAAGLGNPAFMIEDAHAQGMVVMGLVGNVRNARRIAESGVDIVVAQGTEAGGHTGRIGTLALIPQVVDAVAPLPVIAAGGIGDGRGLAAALTLGAEGVWVGTAFLATEESDEFEINKEKVVESDEEGTEVTKIFTGKTMRGIKSRLIDRWKEGGVDTLPMPLQTLLVAELLTGLYEMNKAEYLSGPGGQVSGMITAIRPAREVLEDMVRGAIEILTEDIPGRVTIEKDA